MVAVIPWLMALTGAATELELLGAVSGAVTIGVAAIDGINSYKENVEDGEKFSYELYHIVNTMSRKYQWNLDKHETESLIDAAINITHDKNLDVVEIISDLGMFMETGDFASFEEANEF